jgi:hypothetical protein
MVDKLIGFSIRTGVNAWKRFASSGWPVYTGKVTSYHYEDPVLGCDYGEYRYKYSVDGNSYRGIYRDPYVNGKNRDARKSDTIGIEIQVRVCPKAPAKSFPDYF